MRRLTAADVLGGKTKKIGKKDVVYLCAGPKRVGCGGGARVVH